MVNSFHYVKVTRALDCKPLLGLAGRHDRLARYVALKGYIISMKDVIPTLHEGIQLEQLRLSPIIKCTTFNMPRRII